jgi:predicted nucleotidyltransferase
MRLLSQEIDMIKSVIHQVFGDDARVMLFGSRVDDSQRGGDIDLYVLPKNTSAQWQQTMKALSLLKILLGDQKIDLVIAQDAQRLIEQEALASGVWL